MMAPRPRNKENRQYPTGWRYRKGFFWYRVPKSERHLFDDKSEFPLGKTESQAHREWSNRLTIKERCLVMAHAFDRYEAEVLPTKSASTQKQRAYSIKRLRTAFSELRPDEMVPSIIYRYRDHVSKVKSKKWANVDMETLSHLFSCMVEWGDIDRQPMLGLRFKFALPGKKESVTTEHLIAFAEILPRKWQLYISLKLLTRGRRKGELLRLKLTDATSDGIRFTNNKPPYDEYTVEWTPELKAVWQEIAAMPPRRIGSAHLFVTRKGKAYINEEDSTTEAFNSMWDRYMKKALEDGVIPKKFTENTLRKKAIEGESLRRAQELLRHTTAQTTKKHYTINDRVKT